MTLLILLGSNLQRLWHENGGVKMVVGAGTLTIEGVTRDGFMSEVSVMREVTMVNEADIVRQDGHR